MHGPCMARSAIHEQSSSAQHMRWESRASRAGPSASQSGMQGYVSIDMSVKGEGGHSSMPPVTRLTVRPALLSMLAVPCQS